MKQIFSIITLSLICAILGLAGGWFAGLEKGKNIVQKDKEEHEDHSKPAISKKALENMGIIIHPAKLSSFSKYETIPAIVEELSTTEQPVFAPIGGHVEKIFIQKNTLVKEKEVLLTLIRDAIPRVSLTLTQDVLKPATEEFHKSFTTFRRAVKNLQILNKELKRIKNYSQNKTKGAYPIVPKKRLIEIQYEIDRAKHEVDINREELRRHGLSKEQIKWGKLPQIDVEIWYKSLKHHGLWSSTADKLYKVLPKNIQKLHWTMATIGELVAAGLVKQELVSFFKNNPKIGKYFLEIGGLLQQGSTLQKIYHLYELNAFNPIVKIKVPASQKTWDVGEILVKTHQSVEEGQRLITLKNYRNLYLIARPEGSERTLVLQALQRKLSMEAHSLLQREGPLLKNLQIDNVVSDAKTGIMKAYIKIKNQVLDEHKDLQGIARRTWKLRAKQQYILRIPTKTMKKVYVFPKDAITEDGPNKIIFLQNGDHFKPVEVKLLYQDHEVVVINNDADIFPGDPIVHQGAFALGLALKSDAGADAGHGHGH